MVHGYKELIVWQKSMDLVTRIYQITESFPREEIYGLVSQMRRAAVSIPSNIAEGRLRGTKKDYFHFLIIAYGSGGELETQMEIAKRLPKTKDLNYMEIESILCEVMKMLNAMMQKMRQENPQTRKIES